MQVTLAKSANLPQDAVVSVLAGTSRKQVRKGGRAVRFRNLVEAEATSLKIEVLERLGSAYLVLKPGTDQYKVIFPKTGDHAGMELEVKVMKFDDADAAAGSAEGDAKDPNGADSTAMKDARDWLKQHQVEPFLKHVVQTVIDKKPEDPFGYIARHFLGGYDELAPAPALPAPAEGAKPAEAPTAVVEAKQEVASRALAFQRKEGNNSVLPDIDAVLKACREAGISEKNDHNRRACVGKVVSVMEIDRSNDTAKCYVPSLGKYVWFAARALSTPPSLEAVMEIVLLTLTNVPENAICSICPAAFASGVDGRRIGTSVPRSQGYANTGRPFRFPRLEATAPMEIEILKNVGSADLILQPGVDQYQVFFNPVSLGMEAEIKVENLDGAAAVSAGAEEDADGPDDIKKKRQAVRDYLKQIQLEPFLEVLMVKTLKERPQDPFGYMAHHFKLKEAERKAEVERLAKDRDGRPRSQDLMANSDDLEVLTAALQASSGGVPWPHVRLLVRGGGGDGKTSTVNSMAGREFDSQVASTVGAGMLDVELRCHELCAGTQGSPLQPYTGRDEEYVLALVEHRARLEGAGTAESMLDALDNTPSVGAHVAPRRPAGPAPAAPRPRRAAPATERRSPEGVDVSADTAGAPTSPAPSNSSARASGNAPGELSGRLDGAEAPHGTSAAGVARPPSSPLGLGRSAGSLAPEEREDAGRSAKECQPSAPGDLIVKFKAVQGRAANAERRLTIKVQDTGGQPVFAQLIERLMSPGGTVHMLVFSIPKLQDTFEECVGRLVEHLRAIAAFAPGAPLILVGTRKDSVQSDLTELANGLLRDLRERCPSAISGLVARGDAEAGEGACFFAVENEKGFSADQAIRELVGAVEKAARRLPSMKQLVPLAWLQVYDRLRQEADKGRRHTRLEEVKLIAEGCGMPHFGLTMDQELVSMLTFFHSFNAVLWWDVPELRSLVILDPQWVIDAASCFIREFKLPDHTTGYARMRDIDAEAIREDKDSWTALTEGKGILRRGLLDIFWREADFAEHRSELLAVMCRFGLLVPVPAKKGVAEYIVPALLRSSSQPPASWPQPSADAAQLRLHFSLCDGEETTAIWGASELESGFVPVSTFHSLCSLALGCSKQTSTDEYAVYLDMAFVSFSKERVIFLYRPAEGSIIVQLMAKGSDCSAGNVVDHIRGFLAENLSVYPNLRGRLLVPYPGDNRMWVDLVSLMDTPAGTIQKRLRGTSIMVDKFRSGMVNYFTKECEFCFVDADKLRSASQKEFPDMILKSLQEMRHDHPDWLVKKTISLTEACLGAYRHDHLAVSHRWISSGHPDIDPDHPDMTGKQLQKVQEFLNTDAGSRMKYVFYDFTSCPQGNRTAEEKVEFTTMLANMNMVYIGCSVLVLLDYDFTSRFWTQFESWLSMVKATPSGLIRDQGTPRCFIETMYGTPEAYKVALKSSFGDCKARTAHGLLGAPAIRVTNASDKAMQLPKILELDTLTRHLLVAAGSASPSVADGDDLKRHLRDLEVADIEGVAAALREAGVKSAARFQQLCPDDWAELAELLREAGVKLGDRAAMRDAVDRSSKSR